MSRLGAGGRIASRVARRGRRVARRAALRVTDVVAPEVLQRLPGGDRVSARIDVLHARQLLSEQRYQEVIDLLQHSVHEGATSSALREEALRQQHIAEVAESVPVANQASGEEVDQYLDLLQDSIDMRGALTLGLSRRGWHADLSFFYSTVRHTAEEVPAGPVTWAAKQAFSEGKLEAAALLAEAVIDAHPSSGTVRDIHRKAMDHLQVVRTGWPADEAVSDPGYDPDPVRTLSVLAQSLPHRSGGYATRSHGVLLGLRNRGWNATGLTRLGFPYDRWGRGNTSEVPQLDVVDGVSYERLLEPGHRTYSNTPLSDYIERFARRIERVAKREKAALIHASSFQNNGLAGLRAAKRLGVPFVYEMRGLEDLMKTSANPDFSETSDYRYMVALENHIVANADLTFVITEALRQEMIARGGPPDRIRVLPNGVLNADAEPLPPDLQLKAQLGLGGRTVIGYAGSLVHYEGIDLLLQAVDELRRERDDFAVVIVGDGNYFATLKEIADDLDLNDVVTFTGRVPFEEVNRYLSIFDIMPFPRLPVPACELISPIKPFEAMAMARAMLVSDVAALTEIVQPGVTGLVFRKGDAGSLREQLRRYLDDPELRAQMGQAGRQWVRANGDWNTVVAVVDRAYRDLLGSGPEDAPQGPDPDTDQAS